MVNGRVDLRMNPMNALEDYFIPTRGEGDGTRIDTLPGGQFTGDVDDLNYFQNKLFAALKIPKAYLGYEGDLGNKASLSQQDVRFARTIHNIQRVLIQELNKVAIIQLYSMGYRGDDLLNFKIKMATPSTIAELQSLELWRTKFEVASMANETMFDRHFVYKNVFKLNDQDIEAIKEGKRMDALFDTGVATIQASTQEMPPEADLPDAGIPTPEPQAISSPEPGLPPPPGEESGGQAPGPITSGKDPYKQVAAPNHMLDPSHSNGHDIAKMPNLKNYAFNTKKTAMDPKRNYSELLRGIKAPFGEEIDKEEEVFQKNVHRLKKFASELESLEKLNTKTKKIISD